MAVINADGARTLMNIREFKSFECTMDRIYDKIQKYSSDGFNHSISSVLLEEVESVKNDLLERGFSVSQSEANERSDGYKFVLLEICW